MLVYRVEHNESGLGPYRLYGLYECAVLKRYHTKSMGRGPLEHKKWDRLKETEKFAGYYFGFSSLACLLLWFEGCIEDLAAAGCIIRVYNADKRYVIQDFNQLVFNKDKAEVVQTLYLIETAKKVYGPIDNPRMSRIICVTQENGSKSYEAVCYGP